VTDQLERLLRTHWDVLMILDACRADALHRLRPEAEAVRSPAVCTKHWIRRVVPRIVGPDVTYYSANPKPCGEIHRARLPVDLVDLSELHWGYHSDLQIPSVHPLAVNLRIGTDWQAGRLRDRRIVAHYLQPHSPYIGAVPLAVGRWGRHKDGLGHACHELEHPDRAVARGALTWEHLREAYYANLALALDAAMMLADMLSGRHVIITSDHGELLGEEIGGKRRFGHEENWRHEKLFEVPWLERRGGSTAPSVEERLGALGYLD